MNVEIILIVRQSFKGSGKVLLNSYSFLTFATLSQQRGWCPADLETELLTIKIINNAR